MSVAYVPHGGKGPHRGTEQPALPFELRPPAAPAAVSLLAQARHGLAEAAGESDVVSRFIASYLSALRAAAAVLASRGRPHRGRARPTSVWTLLESAVPELAEWARFFAANSARQAAAQAGATRRITRACADELHREAGDFVALAGRIVHEQQPAGRAMPCDAWPRGRRSRGG